jgi:hypothetical protein
MATVAGDDSVNDGKTQASALPDGLGGKESIEDAVERSAVHTTAIVADGQANVTAFAHLRDGEAVRGQERAAVQAQGNGSGLVANGVRGVGGEVDDDLVELRGIEGHQREIRGERTIDVDGSRESGTNKFESFLDDGFDRLRLPFLILGPAEG